MAHSGRSCNFFNLPKGEMMDTGEHVAYHAGIAVPASFMESIELAKQPHALARAGQVANQVAGAHAFEDYRARKSANTLRRQDNDLALFAAFLRSAKLEPGDFAHDPAAWEGITWGLVEAFRRWLLMSGYAIGTTNLALSTVRVYAAMAAQAGSLDRQELAMIREVHGYKQSDGKHVDEQRTQTRRENSKKSQATIITTDQAQRLKDRPNTPQGRRDRLLFCLLLDHGLRVGELAGLSVADFDLKAGELHFYRPKVDKQQTHRMTPDTLKAARAYLIQDAPALGPIWRGSRKGGELTDQSMSIRAMCARVRDLGAEIGVQGLSPHDLRHYWATTAARSNTPIDKLQAAGGWNSPYMPLRYIEASEIANEGVKLE
jgi:integrase